MGRGRHIHLITFENYLKTQRTSKGDKLQPSTIERYLAHVKPLFKNPDILKDPHHGVIAANAVINNSQNHVFYAAFNHLMEWLDYPQEARSKLQKPNVMSKASTSKQFLQSKVLSRGELLRLFNETEDERLVLAFKVLYDTAMRRSELISIKFGDVEFMSAKDPKHADNIEQGIHAVINIIGKGNKKRQVYLHKSTAMMIKKMHLKEPWEKGDWLIKFKSDRGGWIKNREYYLYNYLREKAKDTIGREVTPHQLRHSKATHMADRGAGILDIGAYLGHEDVKTTQIYVEISTYRSRLAFAKYSEGL